MEVSVCLGAILIPEYLDFHSGYCRNVFRTIFLSWNIPKERAIRFLVNNRFQSYGIEDAKDIKQIAKPITSKKDQGFGNSGKAKSCIFRTLMTIDNGMTQLNTTFQGRSKTKIGTEEIPQNTLL